MRAKGAQVTDIAVLVVAADDGIMPQTLEAIDHARAADVPIIVAVNKIDMPSADIESVKRQLAEQDLLIEEWGGDIIVSPVSALTGDGISDLLENILVVAEINELKANPDRAGRAVIVEARRDKSRGTITTALVQTGMLQVGQNVVARNVRGRVRAMFDDRGARTERAGPSQPVEILGISELLEAGDIIEVMPDEKTAREVVDRRTRESELERAAAPTLEDVYARIEAGEVKALNLIVKTDVQGSIDAVRNSLDSLSTEQTKVNVIHAASGGITESDVLLAVASSAIIVGFNSSPEPGARRLANLQGVDIRSYSVIYDVIEDVASAVEGMLEPVYRDVVEGRATVRAVFNLGRRGRVAGIFVNDGAISRGATLSVIRDRRVLFSGPIASLKHFKDDVREVRNGLEGGVSLEGFNDYREGDVLEAHRTELAQ
jgi:translation initiation factor IF-2